MQNVNSNPAFDPSSFAVPPLRIDIGESEYSFETQTRQFKKRNDELSLTMNGTQTYAYDGKPSDADSD